MGHIPLYQTGAPRAARRRRGRLLLLLVGLATFAIVGAGLGQGLAAMRETAGNPAEGFGERGPGRDVSALLPPPPTPAPPTLAPPTAPVPTQVGADDLPGRAAAAEAALRTGQLEATFEYSHGSRSSVTIAFDLGGREAAPGARRLHGVLTYRGATGSRTNEYVLIGDRAWQRQANGRWAAATSGDDLWRQLEACLPQVGAVVAPTVTDAAGTATLSWNDPSRDADVQLTVDPATGTPKRLHRVERGANLVVSVTFDGWNTPVVIPTPSEG